MKIVVLTPGRGTIAVGQRDMLMRLAMRLHARGDSISTADELTPGFLHHSRNVLLGTLAMRKDVEWGLWLDTDCYLDPDAVLEMSLRRTEDMIVWNYPVRSPFDMEYPPEHLVGLAAEERAKGRRWTGTTLMSPWAGRVLSADGRLVEMYATAFGAVLMRRCVAINMVVAMGAKPPDWNGRTVIPAFDLLNSQVGEDYSFCRRFREAGGRIWCDPKPYVTNGSSGGRFADEIARCDRIVRGTPHLFCVAA